MVYDDLDELIPTWYSTMMPVLAELAKAHLRAATYSCHVYRVNCTPQGILQKWATFKPLWPILFLSKRLICNFLDDDDGGPS